MESSFWHQTATGAIAIIVGLLGWIGRNELARIKERHKEHAEDIDCHRRKLADIPVKYISKSDCDRLHEQAHDELSALVTEVREGFARLHQRLDDMAKLSNERHEKLRDLIDEAKKVRT